MVEFLDAAIKHINQFGTGHTKVIVMQDRTSARFFAARINAATVAVNIAVMPDELFITQKIHSRGPAPGPAHDHQTDRMASLTPRHPTR